MGVEITINNLYDNGVCEEYGIYTGVTYNIDDATSMGTQELPYTWDAGSYTGILCVFVEHCDGHIDSPPNKEPKNQGGFQVRLLNINCEQCPPMPTPNPVDCDMTINVVEVIEPTPLPAPTTDCTEMVITVDTFEE